MGELYNVQLFKKSLYTHKCATYTLLYPNQEDNLHVNFEEWLLNKQLGLLNEKDYYYNFGRAPNNMSYLNNKRNNKIIKEKTLHFFKGNKKIM